MASYVKQALLTLDVANPVLTGLKLNDSGGDHRYIFGMNNLAGSDRIITLPLLTEDDEFTFNEHTQTLKNKTIDFGENIIRNIIDVHVNAIADIAYTKISGLRQSNLPQTLVLGTPLTVNKTKPYSQASSAVVSHEGHGLVATDKIYVVTAIADTNPIASPQIYDVTAVTTGAGTDTFTIDVSSAAATGTRTLDWVGPVSDATLDESGIVLPGDTIHSMLWDNTGDKWKFTDTVKLPVDVKVELEYN